MKHLFFSTAAAGCGLLFGALLGVPSLPGYGQAAKTRPRAPRSAAAATGRAPAASPATDSAPLPSVQNYWRYSDDDQRDFYTKAGAGYPFPRAAGRASGPPRRLKPGAVVLGWHPYWLGNAYVNYDFSLLTHVVYYGYRATSRGGLAAPPGQGPDSLLARAHRSNPACKVLLDIAYPQAEGKNSLLSPSRQPAQELLLAAIARQVKTTHTAGVNLDFCPPDQKPRELLTALEQQLARATQAVQARQQQADAAAQSLQQPQQQLAQTQGQKLALDMQDAQLKQLAATLDLRQKALDRELAQHQQQAPKPLPPAGFLKGAATRVFGLDKKDKEALRQWQQDTSSYNKDGKKLASRQLALNNQVARLGRARLTLAQSLLKTAAQQASQQASVNGNQNQQALNQQQQAAIQATTTKIERRAQDLALRARSYQYVAPLAMQPLANHGPALRDFVARLAVRLWADNPAAVITLSVPAVDNTGTYDSLQSLRHMVSLFVLKAFDYTPYNQVAPGPLAPLNPGKRWGPYSVATSVSHYTVRCGVPGAQLVVGFPHLAKLWRLDSLGGQLVADKQPAQYWTNRQFRLRFQVQQKALLDSVSQSRWTSDLPHAPGQHPPQAWWEDPASLDQKYAWVGEQHLAGVGVWALGYEDGSPQLWNLLRSRFTVPAATPPVAKPPAPPRARGPLAAVYRRRHVLLFSGVVVLGFLLAGLVVAAWRWANDLLLAPRALAVVSLLVGLCLAGMLSYLCWFGRLALSGAVVGGVGLAAGAVALLVYVRSRRQQLLP